MKVTVERLFSMFRCDKITPPANKRQPGDTHDLLFTYSGDHPSEGRYTAENGDYIEIRKLELVDRVNALEAERERLRRDLDELTVESGTGKDRP